MKAVVVGATGATGEALVRQLVHVKDFKEVVTVGRRVLENVDPGTAKLDHLAVDMDKLETEARPAFEHADCVFCCLGTTRKVAGSAAAFKKVDYDYVAATARLAKACGVKQFSLVTAQGANAKVPANDWGVFHPLLYTKTKGLAEQAVLSEGFPRTSIFRPGMLERGAKARPGEKLFSWLSSLDVQDLARLMILDALRDPASAKPVMFFEMGELQRAKKLADVAPSPDKAY
ncbi:hypothetical protein HYH02_007609 [Chlamydomonas schloesseri]|uniref:NAD(P)-binding domain-containing protein n=1 Tax=Chlamydomonas schloesseri TaxID=2026947 RepID=A0A836B4S3_9CHLO|nr:hypothetical protein HYH02_007609 [Chlamydomonas schloesseri]|eukprot:KAG2447279.1 hypothetical protein HYH02_007609 [Chlamydomonas schloesseri]